MTDKIVVFVTCGSAEEADCIARRLVEGRLAACVNIVSNVRSVYRWEGKVEASEEWLLIAKSRRELFSALCEEVRKAHSYSVPETIALAIVEGNPDYLRWVDDETQPA